MRNISYGHLILGLVCLGLIEIGPIRAEESHRSASERSTYHGLIREDANEGDEVDLDIPILLRDRTRITGEVCGYTVYKSQFELPFKVVLQDRLTGAAKLILDHGFNLDYERRHRYHFEIAPHDCNTGEHAERDGMYIEVTDVNEFAPNFSNDSYMIEVVEGELYDEILRLSVVDQDGSDEFSTICHYHILTPNVPFDISTKGILHNTEPITYARNHNFILEVKAEDCGGQDSQTSEKVLINIAVKERCRAGWQGISERIEYRPGSDQKLIAENAQLDLCGDQCRETSVSARIQLTTTHIGKGCDRDTYSIQSQRKLCGASAGSVDLLPNPALNEWTKGLPHDDGQESDQIFSFDGKTNAIEVPSTKFNHTMAQHFTISSWMKHEQNPEDNSKHGTKEHILCNSDGEEMNRHHYSLFVHNCRLVFLMRQEPEGNDPNVFKPAEWRWKIPQVCDGQWHHYAISSDFPEVRLYVDGKIFVNAKNNPEIIDDWPLHNSNKVHFSKLVIGACWQGHDHHLNNYFRGYLAGLTILKEKTESDRVIKCLNNCKEKLEFHAMNEMDTGMSIAFNSEMTEITITGHNHTEVERLVRRVGYLNSRMFPTAGHRSLSLTTDVKCEGTARMNVPDVDALILVLQAEKPIITLQGQTDISHEERDFLHGVKVFRDVEIISRTRKEEEEVVKDQPEKVTGASPDDRYQLDSCLVQADPILNLEVEHLKYPTNLIELLGLEVAETENGLIISGADKLFNYQEVLRQVSYVNRKADEFNQRSFVLTCSELNGRFVSNELTIRVNVLHVAHVVNVPQARGVDRIIANVRPIDQQPDLHLEGGVAGINSFVAGAAHGGGAGVGMTVIIVVCVGFLMFMIVLGIIRIRAAHQRHQVVNVEEKQEMEWDNSALNIIVNPMEEEGAIAGPQPCSGSMMNVYDETEMRTMTVEADDSDSDDDELSDYHDELESSEEESEKVKDRELEWDDSTLTF